jgi:ubiquinone/menaquinone biosynthesis C-methylase UbiE
MRPLQTRSTAPEKMDAPGIPEGDLRRALRDIDRINRWLGGYKLVFGALKNLPAFQRKEPMTLMDLGCGSGDIIRAVSKWAKRSGHPLRFIGVDMNPTMTRLAGNCCVLHENVSFRTADVFDDILLKDQPDIVMSTLFVHHFDREALIRLLKRMLELARQTVIINDPDRHPLAYYGIKYLTRMFSASYLVHYDAPLSVARSLTRSEWIDVLQAAGITNYTMRWRWAWRWEIVIPKPQQS